MATTIQNTNLGNSSNVNGQGNQPTPTINRVCAVMNPSPNLTAMETELHYRELESLFPIGISYVDKGLDVTSVATTLLGNIQNSKKHLSIGDDIVWSVLIDQFSPRVTTHKEFFVELIDQWHWITQEQHQNTQSQKQSQTEDQTTGHVTCTQVLCKKATALQKSKHERKKADGFYLVVAYLISHRIVDIDDLYPFLSLADDDMLQDYHKFEKNMQNQARCLRRTHHVESIQVFINQVNPSLATTAGTEAPNTGSNVTNKRPGHQLPNQKRGILNALLSIGDVIGALTMIERIPPFVQTPYPETADLICRLIKVMISDLDIYPSKSQNKGHPAYSFDQWTVDQLRCLDGKDMVRCVSPLLAYVGSHLHRHPDVVTRICRRMEYEMIELKEAARNETNYERFLQQGRHESQSNDSPTEEEAFPEDLSQMLFEFESEWTPGESVEVEKDAKVKSERKKIDETLFEIESHWVLMTKVAFLPALMLLEPKSRVIHDVRCLMDAVRSRSQKELFMELEDAWGHLKSSREDWKRHLSMFMGGLRDPTEIPSKVWNARTAHVHSTPLVRRLGTYRAFAPMKAGKSKTPTSQGQTLTSLSGNDSRVNKRGRSYQDGDDTSSSSHHSKRPRHKYEENNDEQVSDTRGHDHRHKRPRSEEENDVIDNQRHKRTHTRHTHKISKQHEKAEVSNFKIRHKPHEHEQRMEAKGIRGSTRRQELQELAPTLVNTQESVLATAPEDVKSQNQVLDLLYTGLSNMENTNASDWRRSSQQHQ